MPSFPTLLPKNTYPFLDAMAKLYSQIEREMLVVGKTHPITTIDLFLLPRTYPTIDLTLMSNTKKQHFALTFPTK